MGEAGIPQELLQLLPGIGILPVLLKGAVPELSVPLKQIHTVGADIGLFVEFSPPDAVDILILVEKNLPVHCPELLGGIHIENEQSAGVQNLVNPGNGGGTGGGTIIVAGGSGTGNAGTGSPAEATPQQPDIVQAAREAIALNTPQGDEPFENEAQRLAAIIRAANDELLRRAQAALSPEMEEATQTYIDKLRLLSETFAKVDEQSAKLTRDSEEMENLSRTLTGINKVYELHLKGISLQVGTIEQINEQTNRLAQQIEELNGVYGRMIEALTVNMRGAQPAKDLADK